VFQGQPVPGAVAVLQQGEPSQHALPVRGMGLGWSGYCCWRAAASRLRILPVLLLLRAQQSVQKEVNGVRLPSIKQLHLCKLFSVL